MYKLQLTKTAVKNLRSFSYVDQTLIAKKLHYLSQNFDELLSSKKVTELKGTKDRIYRFVIARKIRAIFQLENGTLTLLILKIGKRKDVYD